MTIDYLFRFTPSTYRSQTVLAGKIFAFLLCSVAVCGYGDAFALDTESYGRSRITDRSRPALRARPSVAHVHPAVVPIKKVVPFEIDTPSLAPRTMRTEMTIKPLQYYNRPVKNVAQIEPKVKVIYPPARINELPSAPIEARQQPAMQQKTVVVLPQRLTPSNPPSPPETPISPPQDDVAVVLPWLIEEPVSASVQSASSLPQAYYQPVSSLQKVENATSDISQIDVSAQPVVVPSPPPPNSTRQDALAVAQPVAKQPQIIDPEVTDIIVERTEAPAAETQHDIIEIAPAPEPMEKLPPLKPEPAPISTETQEILKDLPQDIFPEPRKAKPFDVERSKQEMDIPSDVGSAGIGASVAIRRQAMDVNYELEKAYNALLRGNTDIAISVYQDILAAEPRNQHALFGLATTYHKLGFLEKARPLYGTLLEIDPYNKETLNNFLALVGEEAPESAIRYLEQLKGQNSDFSPIYAQLAQLYLKDGNTMLAIENMQEAVAMSPENLIYKYNLAVMYDNAKEPQRAIVLYRQLIKAGLDGAELPANLRDIQERLTFLSSN
jgi:Tfp pilus assembly protein PilF